MRLGAITSGVVAALLCTCGQAMAGAYFGAQTSASTGDIYPGGGIRNGAYAFGGGEGLAASSIYLNDGVVVDSDGTGPWDRGVGAVSVTLSELAVPPTIGVGAELTGKCSTLDFNGSMPIAASVFASGAALAAFQYIGDSPRELELYYEFTADVSISPLDTMWRTRAYAQVSVWDDGMTRYSVDGEELEILGGTMISASRSITFNETTNGYTTRSALVVFYVNPGDIFHVLVKSGAVAMYGESYADALGTFQGEFDRPDLVRSLVPAPGGAALGLLGMAGVFRRRR